MASVALFTLSSALCGFAPSLTTVDSVPDAPGRWWRRARSQRTRNLSGYLHAAERPMAFAIYGTAVILAPAIGPIVGGWVTDHYSGDGFFSSTCRRGFVSLFLTYHLIEDPPYLTKLRMQARRKRRASRLRGIDPAGAFVGPSRCCSIGDRN